MSNIPDRVKAFNKDRLPQYTRLKYAMMSQSAFRFFRGTCHLFYEDLAKVNDLPNSPLAWICGDLHLENYGSYKGDNRLEYFDLNDFDEAVLAPANWDVLRMLTSIFVGFDSLKIKATESKDAASLFLKIYCRTLSAGKSRYTETQTAKGIVKTFLDNVGNRKQKELLKQKAIEKKGKLVFLIDNTHFYKLEKELKTQLLGFIDDWLKSNLKYKNRFKILDSAFRVAGTGSVGVNRYAFLVEKLQKPPKYLLVDMKQAVKSSLEPFLSTSQPPWANEAERVVSVQMRMQNVSPAFLTSVNFKNDSYVLKELQPIADKINFELIKDRYKDIKQVIEDMAMLTASAQLRSAGRQGSAIADELILSGQNNDWQKTIIEYAAAYSKQVKKDYVEFAKAYHQKYFS